MVSLGIKEFWRIRIVIAGNSLYVASLTEPAVDWAAAGSVLSGISLDLIKGTPLGVTPGYMKREAVESISWEHVTLME